MNRSGPECHKGNYSQCSCTRGQIGNWNPRLSEELMIVLGYTGKEPQENKEEKKAHA